MPRRAISRGLLLGIVGLHLAAVGLLLQLHQRWIVIGTISLGQAVLLLLAVTAGIMAAPNAPRPASAMLLLSGAVAGASAGLPLALLTVAMNAIRLQFIFIALSRDLFDMLSFGLGAWFGPALLIGGGAFAGLCGAASRYCPTEGRHFLLAGISSVVIAGVFQELIQLMLQYEGPVGMVRDFFYTWEGLSPEGAAVIFLTTGFVAVSWRSILRRRQIPAGDYPRQRLIRAAFAVAALALLPALAGSYIGQVLMMVGLYILMGMGLNLEVGLAGLLDLGFVAFFAVGAYATALLTANNPHALLHLSYWAAMPIAVLLSIGVGVLFGIPILGVRGDYLAVATMGLGEIVRVIVMSDFASPLLGGAQGLLQIPKPHLGSFQFSNPVLLFYLTLAASAIAAFVAWRLENARLGRTWMALRDDEDVAQALGINLIRSKLLAYGLGAAFAGLSGSIFAVMLGSVYPSSFQLLISINVLALIIVGGMGSLPGVALGSMALIGIPELLREFGEYRYLLYGAALIVMMRLRPEGLWPSEARRRELHDSDEALAQDIGADLLPAQRS
jgi:branched-chain amino acid transport system permease protein